MPDPAKDLKKRWISKLSPQIEKELVDIGVSKEKGSEAVETIIDKYTQDIAKSGILEPEQDNLQNINSFGKGTESVSSENKEEEPAPVTGEKDAGGEEIGDMDVAQKLEEAEEEEAVNYPGVDVDDESVKRMKEGGKKEKPEEEEEPKGEGEADQQAEEEKKEPEEEGEEPKGEEKPEEGEAEEKTEKKPKEEEDANYPGVDVDDESMKRMKEGGNKEGEPEPDTKDKQREEEDRQLREKTEVLERENMYQAQLRAGLISGGAMKKKKKKAEVDKLLADLEKLKKRKKGLLDQENLQEMGTCCCSAIFSGGFIGPVAYYIALRMGLRHYVNQTGMDFLGVSTQLKNVEKKISGLKKVIAKKQKKLIKDK